MRVSRAFDRSRLAVSEAAQPLRRPARPAEKRSMSVRAALEWAFGTELARVDFDLTGAREFDRVAVSPEWRILQERRLGCRVDGGGGCASDPHPDAAWLAAAVEALAINPVYGRDMVILIAECARAGVAPDWRGQPERRVVPCGWDITDHGWTAHEVRVADWSFRDSRARMRSGHSYVCPISYSGGAVSISRARRRYLGWIGGLLEIRSCAWGLKSIEISEIMPPMSPWRETC